MRSIRKLLVILLQDSLHFYIFIHACIGTHIHVHVCVCVICAYVCTLAHTHVHLKAQRERYPVLSLSTLVP